MRRIIVLLISCIFVMNLCGCRISEDSIKLESDKELVRAAEEKHGKAELLDTQVQDSPGKYKIVKLRDVRRGFTYCIKTQPHSVGLDGATFGYDGTVIWDDFQISYTQWLTDVTRDEFEAHGIKVYDDWLPNDYDELGTDRAVSVNRNRLVTTKDRVEEDLEYIIRTICSHDQDLEMKREWFSVHLSPDMEYFGQFTFEEILDDNVMGLRYMKKQVKKICGIDIDGFDRVTDIRADRVPGLEEQNLDRTSLDSDDLTKIYYFTYEGQEYFICEAKVYRDAKDGETLEYYQNYTN